MGLRLSREDLSQWVDLSKPKKLRKPEAWQSFWHAAIEIAKGGRLNEAEYPTKKKLREEILSMIDDSLEDRTIKKPVQLIWEKFCEGDSG